jgi:hypothetical protein
VGFLFQVHLLSQKHPWKQHGLAAVAARSQQYNESHLQPILQLLQNAVHLVRVEKVWVLPVILLMPGLAAVVTAPPSQQYNE